MSDTERIVITSAIRDIRRRYVAAGGSSDASLDEVERWVAAAFDRLPQNARELGGSGQAERGPRLQRTPNPSGYRLTKRFFSPMPPTVPPVGRRWLYPAERA